MPDHEPSATSSSGGVGTVIDPRDAYPFVDRIMQDDDVDDPLLESYQN